MQRIGDATGSLQCLPFWRVGNVCAKAATVAKRSLNLLTEMGVVDYQISDACSHQSLDLPDDQRLAADRQQRFRAGIGQRSHAFAAAGRKNHGFQNVYPVCTARFSSSSSSLRNGPSSR